MAATVLQRPLPAIRNKETGAHWTVDVAKSMLQKAIRRGKKIALAAAHQLIAAGYTGCVFSSLRTIVSEDIGPANSDMVLICERMISEHQAQVRKVRKFSKELSNAQIATTDPFCRQIVYALVKLAARSRKSRICDLGFHFAYTRGETYLDYLIKKADSNVPLKGEELIKVVKAHFLGHLPKLKNDFYHFAHFIGALYILDETKFGVEELLKEVRKVPKEADQTLTDLCDLFLGLREDDAHFRLLLIHVFMRFAYLDKCPPPLSRLSLANIAAILESTKTLDLKETEEIPFDPPEYALDKHTLIGRSEFKRGFKYFFEEGTKLQNTWPALDAVDTWTPLAIKELLEEEAGQPMKRKRSHETRIAEQRKRYGVVDKKAEAKAARKRKALQGKKRPAEEEAQPEAGDNTSSSTDPPPKTKKAKTAEKTIPQVLEKLKTAGRQLAKRDALHAPAERMYFE